MPNQVHLHTAGHIEHTYTGDQTAETIAGIVQQTTPLTKHLRQSSKPVHILVDITDLGKLTIATRKAAAEALIRLDYDRIAIFGSNTYTKALINLIIHAAGKDRAVTIFTTKAHALGWLGQHAEQQA